MGRGAEEEPPQRLSPGPRVGEASEHERDPRIGDERGGAERNQRHEPARELEHTRGAYERRVAYRKSLQLM